MNVITTTDPRTAMTVPTELSETTNDQLDQLLEAATAAAQELDSMGRGQRAALLDAIATHLEDARSELVKVADEETGLGQVRLEGELKRAAFQFRLFATALREGSYVEAAIDHAADTELGPDPEVRRMLVPIGPVAVFGASNFPFAFSVAGGDTASALAAGCPVLCKAHDSHPLTSLRSFKVIQDAIAACNAPSGTAGLVFGQDAGAQLVKHPAIKAVGFTGSLHTAQVLMQIMRDRDEPVPFYGELSSLNPVIVSPGAAHARGSAIAAGLFASFTGSGGQFCTKPGIAFVPRGPDGDTIVEELAAATRSDSGHVLLNGRIQDGFNRMTQKMRRAPNSDAVAGSPLEEGFTAQATLLATSLDELTGELTQECFGPLMVVARYADLDELRPVLSQLPGSLTASIHAEEDEGKAATALTRALAPIAGRVIYNGYPTGVRVSWAQHHGGPWPSTNTLHTSVGVSAIRRFLRPLAFQNAPQDALPEELRDDYSAIPRRVDGNLMIPNETIEA